MAVEAAYPPSLRTKQRKRVGCWATRAKIAQARLQVRRKDVGERREGGHSSGFSGARREWFVILARDRALWGAEDVRFGG